MHGKLRAQPDGGGIAASLGRNAVRGVQRRDKTGGGESTRGRGDAGGGDRHFDAALEIRRGICRAGIRGGQHPLRRRRGGGAAFFVWHTAGASESALSRRRFRGEGRKN